MLRLLTTLEGEVVRDVKPIIGYVHTGIEKSCEDQQYWKAITFVERMDYLAYYYNAMAFCMSVERLLEEEVPERAQWLRVLHMELNRISSHLFWIATASLDIGAITMLWWGCRDRDLVLDLFEMSSGQRMHTRYFQVGGVMEDIPPGFEAKVREFLEIMPRRLDQYEALLDHNEIWLRRMKGTGIVSQEDLLGLGVTGPLLRASGHWWDLRKAMPYSSYEKFDFNVPVGSVGDNYDRYKVRIVEMRESLKIVEQALDGLPEGPYITSNRKVALPPRHELATSMEALIHHFKLVTEGFRVPPGEAYAAVESPARRARVLRGGRRLGQARARAHARPELREPAGAAGDGQGLAAGGLHRLGGHARPDPRRGGPVRRDEGALRSAPLPPGWDEADRLDDDPATVPDPATVDVPPALRAEIEAPHGQVPRAPLGHPARARRRAARARLVLARGDPPGGRGDAGHPRIPVGRGHLLRHAAHPAHGQPLRVRLHQRGLPPAGRQVGVRRHRRRGARAGPRGRGGARVRVPGRLRDGPDGLRGRALRGPDRHRRGGRVRGRASRRAATRCPGRGLGDEHE